jgi:hypothetical protein
MRKIIIGFLCLFASITIVNDLSILLNVKEDFYVKDSSKYLLAAITSISVFFIKWKENSKKTIS